MSVTFKAQELTATIPLAVLVCWTCGIRYGVDRTFYEILRDSEKSVYCPRGHRSTYTPVKPQEQIDAEKLKAENERLKRELVQAIHDADQAQARKENTLPEVPTVPTSKAVTTAAELPPDGPDRHTCPECGKVYKLGWRWREHRENVHKVDTRKEYWDKWKKENSVSDDNDTATA